MSSNASRSSIKRKSYVLVSALFLSSFVLLWAASYISKQQSALVKTKAAGPVLSYYTGSAAPCTLYASPSGNDSNSGSTQSTPITLNAANNRITPGAVVCLTDGTYSLSGPLYIGRSGSASSWIVFRALNPGKATIKWNTQTSDDMFQVTSPQTSYIEISGLVFDGSYNGQNTANNAIHPHRGSHHVKIINNTMKNLKASGVATSGSDYNWILGNIMHHIGNYTGDLKDGWGSGVSLNSNVWSDSYTGLHSVVAGNIISGIVDGSSHNTDGNGIIMDLSEGQLATGNTPPVLIANNVIYQNGGRCIHTLGVSNIWVVNNSCYANSLDSRLSGGSVGEYAFHQSRDIYVVNNIVHSWTKGFTFYHLNNLGNIYYYRNIGFGGRGAQGVNASVLNDVNQIRSVNPLFMSAPILNATSDGQYAAALNPEFLQNNFYLQPGSIGINGGIDPTTLTTNTNLKSDLAQYVYRDIEGVSRPKNGAFDLGAYESQGVVSSTTPLPTVAPSSIPTSIPTTNPTQIPSGGSSLTIYAGGTQAGGVYPSMELLISDGVVRSWTNISADAPNRIFNAYTYTSASKIQVSQVKIRFTNDAQVGTDDRNLYVDKIVLDGVTYQTESPGVFSTGTYTSDNGCGVGYKKSEILHCPGYFHYQVSSTTVPSSTPSPTAIPSSSQVVDFNALTNLGTDLNGSYPSGVIDWGTARWYKSGPWGKFTTNSVSFSNETSKVESFTFMNPKMLSSIQAYNGGAGSTTVSLSCSGNVTKTQTLNAGVFSTITTGWTVPCSTVTVNSSNGWWTNFDNITIK